MRQTITPATRPMAAKRPNGRYLAVAAGKGGVGTATVAALIASCAAATGRDVLLVDHDENFGTLHHVFGVERTRTISDLRGGRFDPVDLLVPIRPGLTLVPGGTQADAELMSGAERRLLSRRLAGLYSSFDGVILHVGARREAIEEACDAGVDTVLAVTTPDRVALATTYALLKLLAMRSAPPAVEIVANRHDDIMTAESLRHLRAAATQFLRIDVALAGSIPDEATIAALLPNGPQVLRGQPSAALAAGEALAERVLTGAHAAAALHRQPGFSA